MLFVISILSLGGLAFLLASGLVIADKVFYVEEDLRLRQLEQLLPRTNCGGCGYAGCHAFAEALIDGDAQPGGCTVSTAKEQQIIANFLGVSVGQTRKRVARLACAGGDNVARNRAHYHGWSSCAAADVVAGGGKSCFWGCLGLGDCQTACTFDAIEMNSHALPEVNVDRCTACGDCVEACPKELFSIHDINDRLWINCSSLAQGDDILADCAVACTACGRCAADAPESITIQNGLPVINYDQPISMDPTQRCPTGAIVWLDDRGFSRKGISARKVIRKSTMRDTET